MKIFILCGGLGTRLNFEGTLKAKPMVMVGRDPIIKHIINNFSDQGFGEFVLCLGHKSETIINYFLKEKKTRSKIISKNKNYLKIFFYEKKKKLIIHLINTGKNSGTGGRIKIAYKKLKLNEDIFMTYGDGLCNVNIRKLIKFHYKNNATSTLTAVRPKERYGIIEIQNNKITKFNNSKDKSNVYINGGFFVISKKAINLIKDKNDYWEDFPLKYLRKNKKLFAFKHDGFWHSLDTMKDKNDLNNLYKNKRILWKIKKIN